MPHTRRTLALIILALTVCACGSSASSAPTPTAPPPATAIALTFDTGVEAGHMAEVLDILHLQSVRATFSITGVWAEQHRDLLLAIAAGGHQIINGTYHGTSFTGASTGTPPLTAEERTLELSRTEVTIYHLTGRSTRPYWHPPRGDIDDSAVRDAAAAGYTTAVLATVDSSDGTDASPDTIVARSKAAGRAGVIYLMHAGAGRQDAAALPSTIAGLRARGAHFVTIDELLKP